MAVAVHFHGQVYCLEQRVFVNSGEDEVAFVEGFRAFSGSTYAHGGNGITDTKEERGFFWEGAGVTDYGESIHLQVIIVVETEGFVSYYARVEFEATLL